MSAGSSDASVSGRQIVHGVAWLMSFKVLDKGVGFLSTLLLARLLAPSDFGLVAMAMAVLAVTQLMSAFGFDTALIQRQDAGRELFDTAWTFNVIFGVSIATVLVVLAVPMARFYEDDRLVGILCVLALSAFIAGFENIGVVKFRKELDFRSEFRFLLIKRLASFAVTVGLALTLRSYWALVSGMVTGSVLSVFISYRLHAYRPRLSLAARRDLMQFSKWLFFSNLINVANGRSTDFILGRTVGAHGLGVYSVGYEIATMPSTELIAPLNRATYPVYSKLAGNPVELRARFLQIFGAIALVAIPACAGLLAVADAAVRVLLGEQWIEAVHLIQIFTICGLVGALQSNMYLVFLAMGRPQTSTSIFAVLVLTSLPVTVWASIEYGIAGASYARLGEAAVAMIAVVVIFTRVVEVRARALLSVVWRPIVGASAMTLAVMSSDAALVASMPDLPAFVRLVMLVLEGGVTYCAVTWLLWKACGAPLGAESVVLGIVGERLRGLRGQPA